MPETVTGRNGVTGYLGDILDGAKGLTDNVTDCVSDVLSSGEKLESQMRNTARRFLGGSQDAEAEPAAKPRLGGNDASVRRTATP